MSLALAVILLGAANVANAVMIAVLARWLRRANTEIIELQATVDLILLKTEGRSYFADRYDLDVVIDPTKMQPPREPTTPDPFVPERRDDPPDVGD